MDLMSFLVQRRIVDETVLHAVKAQMEKPVPVMSAPGGSTTVREERPITASLGPFTSSSGHVARLTASYESEGTSRKEEEEEKVEEGGKE